MQITDWLDDDEAPHCSMRCLAGTDKNDVKNRVAFIEKTPRVRVAPYTEVDDWKNWTQGPKGCAPEYGHYQPSRDWCDEQLRALGYTSVSESDRARIEWCIAAVREIADLGRDKPLGDLYPQAVMVIDALKRVLEPNVC